MDLSIIIVSYNTKELLDDCLKSIQASAKGISHEVFVIDNNSKDGTVEFIKSNYPQVKLIANSQNLGFSKANNIALKKARGDLIIVLNPDTKLMSDTLSQMVNFIKHADPEIAVATCRVELPNGDLDRDCRRLFPTPWRAFCHFSKLSSIFPKSRIFGAYQMGYISDSKEHEIDSCAGAFMLVKKPALDKVGLFDEDFFFYGEDLDLCARFKDAGYKIVYTPITKITHYKGAASGMKSTSQNVTKATKDSKRRAIKESTRAMELFYKKHYMDKYPFFITWPIILAIRVLTIIRLIAV